MNSKDKSFGIGCFHFGVKKKPPFQFSGSQYLQELEKALAKISNLTKLKIDSDEDFKNYTDNLTEITENLEDDEGYFPRPLILNIEFDLYIPFRIQSEITGTEEKRLSTFTENFNVKIVNSFYLPVAIIEPISPSKRNEPSTAVQIVREFIRRELTDSKSDYIRFECLGPSPFHFDCFLEPKKPSLGEDWFFTSEAELQKGYDNLRIFYNSDEIQDANEALEYLMTSILDEFGFFYKCIQMRNAKMHYWEIIQSNIDLLLAIQRERGVSGIWKRFFVRPKLIEMLYTDITTFEGKDIYLRGIQQNDYKEAFYVKEEIFFQDFIDKQLEEKLEYPVKQTTDLIVFFESRRVKSMDQITILTAAILGGVVGALLTISIKATQIPISNSTGKTSSNISIQTVDNTTKSDTTKKH